MTDFVKGVVILDDITENGFRVLGEKQLNAMLETFEYDFEMPANGAGRTFGATEPSVLEFSIRLHSALHGKTFYTSGYTNELQKLTFLFGHELEYRRNGDKIKSYKYGLVAHGYIVHLEEEFHSGKDSQGLERQTIMHAKMLLTSIRHISGMKGEIVQETRFVNVAKKNRQKEFVKGDSGIRLNIYEKEDEILLSVAGATASLMDSWDINKTEYIFTLQYISFTKTLNRPNETKARLYIYPTAFKPKRYSRKFWEKQFINKRAELMVDEMVSVCDNYYVEKVVPTYCENGSVYLDLTIYSPDYLLTKTQGCKAYVGKRLSDIVKELADNCHMPYDEKKTLEYADMTKTMHQLVTTDGKEHIVPYLVQYNESSYDFLRRTANRWGEFMYYEGVLTFGYHDIHSNNKKVDFGPANLDQLDTISYCHSISFDGPSTQKDAVEPLGDVSLEAAQEFLDDVLHKDVYEDALNEIDTIKNSERGHDKYVMKNLGRAFTTAKDMPTWASDSLVADLVSYGQAKRYTDALRAQFNDVYFVNPKDEKQKYAQQFVKENNVNNVFNEFTETDATFRAYDIENYPKVLAQELSRSKGTLVIDFDTLYPRMGLGSKFTIGNDDETFYIVTEITMELKDQRPKWQVKAIKGITSEQPEPQADAQANGQANAQANGQANAPANGQANAPANAQMPDPRKAKFYPPYLPTGHTRKSGMLKAEVVDADDPMRKNRVRVRFEWQTEDSDPTPWLLVAQDGTIPGAGSHVRHYKGEKVLVDFIGGNVERPYVVGSIQEQLPLKDSWDSPIDAILRTPNGQRLQMSDGTGRGLAAFRTAMRPGLAAMQSLSPDIMPLNAIDFWKDDTKQENKRFEGSVEIKDYYNIYQIKCSTNDRQVSISSPWGNVDINAFTGINISAPNGDIRISGKNVTIEAGNNLKLISGTNIQNKFIPEEGAKALGNNLAMEAAAKALLAFDEKGAIDFAMLRHVRDMFIKPVEGVLEVQSNRFLKLEADGAITGYPASAYKSMRLPDKSQRTEEQWYQMGDGIASLIEASWAAFYDKYRDYCQAFDTAQVDNKAFIAAVNGLKVWSEATEKAMETTRVCNLYPELKSKLLNNDNGELKEEDMGFVNDLVGVDKNAKTDQCQARKQGYTAENIIENRKTFRTVVLGYANDLLTAIRKMKACQFDSQEIGIIPSESYKHLPKDYEDVVKKALSKEKCSQSELYKTMTDLKRPDLEEEKYKKLADDRDKETQEQLTALKHLIALNLLEGLGFKAKKDNQKMEISDLVKSKEDLLGNWNKTAGYIDYEFDPVSSSLASFRRMKVHEKDVWSEAKNGQILISSGTPYTLGKETKPVYQKANEVDTSRLVNVLSEPIKKAMEVSAIEKINISDSATSTNVEEISRMQQLVINPKAEK